MEMSLLLWMVAALLVIIGFAGLVLPALPGIALIFCGLVVAAWAEQFAYVGWKTITFLGLLALFAGLIDLLAGVLGAKKFGAGRYALIGASNWRCLRSVFRCCQASLPDLFWERFLAS